MMGNLIRFLAFNSFSSSLPLYSTDCEPSLDIIHVMYFYNLYNYQKMCCYLTVVLSAGSGVNVGCQQVRPHPPVMSAAKKRRTVAVGLVSGGGRRRKAGHPLLAILLTAPDPHGSPLRWAPAGNALAAAYPPHA
jgi:hypothetical protein